MYPNLHTPQNECQNCNDAGVLGPVPGLIGILQAMETIKLLTTAAPNAGSASNTHTSHRTLHDKLLMYDAMSSSFMTITKPKRNPNCIVCGPRPTILSLDDTLDDLHRTATCPIPQSTTHCNDNDISCMNYYDQILRRNVPHVLLDVRVPIQYSMCSFVNSVNIPLDELLHNETTRDYIWTALSNHTTLPIYCICRRGIASRDAVRILQDAYRNKVAGVMMNGPTNPTHDHGDTVTTTTSPSNPAPLNIYNIVGGYVAWQQQVDRTFPKY